MSQLKSDGVNMMLYANPYLSPPVEGQPVPEGGWLYSQVIQCGWEHSQRSCGGCGCWGDVLRRHNAPLSLAIGPSASFLHGHRQHQQYIAVHTVHRHP